jgi:hypothetical protein
MRIHCPIHGAQSVTWLSPDLQNSPQRAAGAVHFAYEYAGQNVWSFLLSADFVAKHAIQGGTFPLPDQYPKWMDEVTYVCARCFDGRDDLNRAPSAGKL